MALCPNRPEGFGPSSSLSSPIPTTCFVDVILVPLPTWIYFVLLPCALVYTLRRRRADSDSSALHMRITPQRSALRTTVVVIYFLIILANILMQILEIVRLSLINYGVGLLPFSFVSLLLVPAMRLYIMRHARLESSMLVAANMFLWVGLMIMSIVKTVGLAYEYKMGETRIGSRYPVMDQITDVAVTAALYVLLAVLELVLGAWRPKASQVVEQEAGDVVEVEGERLEKASTVSAASSGTAVAS